VKKWFLTYTNNISPITSDNRFSNRFASLVTERKPRNLKAFEDMREMEPMAYPQL